MFDFRRYSAAVVGVVFPFASMIPPVGGGLPLVQSGAVGTWALAPGEEAADQVTAGLMASGSTTVVKPCASLGVTAF